jgi:hypothetical protein
LPQPWYQAWIDAITKPTVAAYEALVSRAGVSTGRAALWVFLANIVGSAVTFALLAVSPELNPFAAVDPSVAPDLSRYPLIAVCGAPVAAVFAVAGLLIVAGISHAIARALGGAGTYPQLTYAMAAYSSPISIIGSAIAFVPVLKCLGLPLGLYALYLNVLSIRAVHRLSWGRALLSSVAILAGVLVIAACLAIVFLALIGPAIGTVFSNIITEMP